MGSLGHELVMLNVLGSEKSELCYTSGIKWCGYDTIKIKGGQESLGSITKAIVQTTSALLMLLLPRDRCTASTRPLEPSRFISIC